MSCPPSRSEKGVALSGATRQWRPRHSGIAGTPALPAVRHCRATIKGVAASRGAARAVAALPRQKRAAVCRTWTPEAAAPGACLATAARRRCRGSRPRRATCGSFHGVRGSGGDGSAGRTRTRRPGPCGTRPWGCGGGAWIGLICGASPPSQAASACTAGDAGRERTPSERHLVRYPSLTVDALSDPYP